jgi:DNA polymerase-3 subunit delta'
VAEHVHPDVVWVEPESTSRAITIDQIRALEKTVYQSSFAGGWKSCVVVGADRMAAPTANAFLKTLEEPPERTLFFLLTDSPQFLLPTVVSRCQRLTVSNDQVTLPAEWQEALRAVLVKPTRGTLAGAMGRVSELEALFAAMKAAATAEVKESTASEEVESNESVVKARLNARYRELRTGAMQYLLRWYRDLMVVVCGGSAPCLYQPGEVEVFRKLAVGLQPRDAIRHVERVESMNRNLEGNVTETAAMAHGFANLP